MLIDWFTVSVQIINFLILIGLLKHFLYGPIIRAMEERESKISARLAEAAAARKEAEMKAAALAREQEEFAASRNRMQSEAQQEVNSWKEESVERIRKEIAGQRQAWQKDLEEEQKAFARKLKIHISRQVFLVARKAMADLADAGIEESLLQTFMRKVEEEPGAVVGPTVGRMKLQVATGFALESGRQEELRQRLERRFTDFSGVDFSREEELGFGIRLLAGDRKWEWNLSRYMRDIEKEIVHNMSVAVGAGDERKESIG